MGGISHLCHRLRPDCHEEAEVHAFRRLLLVLLIKDWQANPGFVLVLPYGSPFPVDSEEVRLVSPLLWLNNAEGGQYPHEIGLFATDSEERDSYRSFRSSNHEFLLSRDTRSVAAESVKCFCINPGKSRQSLLRQRGVLGVEQRHLRFGGYPLRLVLSTIFQLFFSVLQFLLASNKCSVGCEGEQVFG